jgi:hypothetical protein
MIKSRNALQLAVALALAAQAVDARADAVTEWNSRAGEFITEAKLGTPPAVRVMAMVQTAVAEAVDAAQDVSVDAAVASANRAMLMKMLPAQQASIETAYKAVLAKIDESPAKAAGIAYGELAADRVIARRADDNAAAPNEYRPHTAAGTYVPTAMPAVTNWMQRKPWLMASTAQFRPAPPPSLSSDAWVRDFNEVKTMGAKDSKRRTDEQSQVARFWEYSLPSIYFGVVRSVADAPGRDAMRNARLYAAAAQAMDDAMISVFEAKYHYNFWRPITAIRNGDGDGSEATVREATWMPMIDAPMHPEFPSGHSILAACVGAVIKADVGSGSMPMLTTTSPTAKGASRQWRNPDEFVREVSDSRVFAGIHFRSATEAGAASGRKIGELAATRYLQPLRMGEAK